MLTLEQVEGAGGYGVLLADPAWSYDQRGMGTSGARDHYKTMTPDELARLPVGRLAARDAALFMWAPWPQLPHALAVGAAWGFIYRTLAFVWVKRTKGGAVFTGQGFWTRSCTEPCLLFARGRGGVVDHAVHQVIEDDMASVLDAHRGPHSTKPQEARDRIVRLLGDVPRCELFARQRVAGWDAWGDEVPGGSDFNLEVA